MLPAIGDLESSTAAARHAATARAAAANFALVAEARQYAPCVLLLWRLELLDHLHGAHHNNKIICAEAPGGDGTVVGGSAAALKASAQAKATVVAARWLHPALVVGTGARQLFGGGHCAASTAVNRRCCMPPSATMLQELYGEAVMDEYRGRALGVLPPHVYAIAERTRRAVVTDGTDQSSVVSGESGAGNTESCLAMVQYLARHRRRASGDLAATLLAANLLIEARRPGGDTAGGQHTDRGVRLRGHHAQQQRVALRQAHADLDRERREPGLGRAARVVGGDLPPRKGERLEPRAGRADLPRLLRPRRRRGRRGRGHRHREEWNHAEARPRCRGWSPDGAAVARARGQFDAASAAAPARRRARP